MQLIHSMHRTIDKSLNVLTGEGTVNGQSEPAVSYCLAHMKLYMVLHTKQIIFPCETLLVFDLSGCGGIKTAEHHSQCFHTVDLIPYRDSWTLTSTWHAFEKCWPLKPKKIHGLFGLALRKCVLSSDWLSCEWVYWNEMEAPPDHDSCRFFCNGLLICNTQRWALQDPYWSPSIQLVCR